MGTTFFNAISDIDRDSLYTLPLSIIPLETPALRRARLIKNVRLDSVVEIFADPSAGSGQLMVESLPHIFEWPDGSIHPDLVTMRKLAMMPSFDVYSLRILLREHGIAVNSHDALRLSQAKNRDLTSYMTTFTRPLILNIYGDQDIAISSFEDIASLFRSGQKEIH